MLDGDLWTPSWPGWSGALGQRPPGPPKRLTPEPDLPILLVDPWGVYLCDPGANFIGLDGGRGRGGPVANVLDAQRAGARNL